MAHKTYQYCVAENWGKGFITADDSRKLALRGFPGRCVESTCSQSRC